MDLQLFKITEHEVPCQHIRERPHATANSQEDTLHLAVKQYTPLSNLNPGIGDVTIIATPSNGMPKELYEPLWEDLFLELENFGLKIRNIWAVDMAHQGSSVPLNEKALGNDPHWFDHSRDLLQMVNHFRADMPRPILGLGHSVGAAQLVFLSTMHPRLLATLVLIDPLLLPRSSMAGRLLAKAATFRRDVWKSRVEAESAIRKNPFFKQWDKRAMTRLLMYALRTTPTLLHPEETAAVTLQTPKHQEAFTVFRPNFGEVGVHEEPSLEERVTHPDISPELRIDKAPFYRVEATLAFRYLPTLRPSVLYIFGSDSQVCTPQLRDEQVNTTGTDTGGSGGPKLGVVTERVLAGGHCVPMENVRPTAEAIAQHLRGELARWTSIEDSLKEDWDDLSTVQKQTMDRKWMIEMKNWDLKNTKATTTATTKKQQQERRIPTSKI